MLAFLNAALFVSFLPWTIALRLQTLVAAPSPEAYVQVRTARRSIRRLWSDL